VPEFAIALAIVKLNPAFTVRVVAELIVNELILTLLVIIGWLALAAMSTSEVEVGTEPEAQFVAVDQFVELVPVQVSCL
jgi:hypothetical protein